ncbi:MAG: hypothetical protein CME06_02980 [Gemmatimonadetes bacterium]|nr:hypothetical protein [Gemmatimonadota bacterium]
MSGGGCVRASLLVMLLLGVLPPTPATKIDPLMQFQLERPNDEEPFSFGLRRSRFAIEEDLGKRRSLSIEVKVRPDDVELLDGYVEAEILEGFEIQLGRFKKPFSRGALIASSKLRTTERDIVYDLFGANNQEFAAPKGESDYVGRDEGLMFRWSRSWASRAIEIELAAMNGQGPKNEDDDDEKQWISRSAFRLGEGLSCGAGLNWARSSTHGNGFAWEVDLSLEWRSLSIWGEWLAADNRLTGTDMTGSTVEGALDWRGVVPGIRASRIDPDRDVLYNALWEWTPFVGIRVWKGSALIAEFTHLSRAKAPGDRSDATTDRIVLAWRFTP